MSERDISPRLLLPPLLDISASSLLRLFDPAVGLGRVGGIGELGKSHPRPVVADRCPYRRSNLRDVSAEAYFPIASRALDLGGDHGDLDLMLAPMIIAWGCKPD